MVATNPIEHMTRIWNWDFFMDGTSVSSDAGRAFLAARMDELDDDINTAWGHFANGTWPVKQVEMWKKTSNVSISSGVQTSLSGAHTAIFQKAGTTAAFSVNSGTGTVTFTSAGLYRITFNIEVAGSSYTEGDLYGGFPGAGFRTIQRVATNNFDASASTILNFTTMLEVNSTDADITPGTTQTWVAYQQNSSGTSFNFLAANSWFAIEYVDTWRQG